jgi:GxxExxY protein
MGPLENPLSKRVIEAAIEVHRTLGGPGLLEVVYEEALCWELQQRGMKVKRQPLCPIRYKGVELGSPLRIDLLVDDLVIVECKATMEIPPVFEAQLLTYLRVTGLRLGLLLNFGQRHMKDGIRRVVNGLE